MRRGGAALLAGLVLGSLSGCRTEGPFPDRPILLLCPWGAGGGTDRVARQMAALLEADLGVRVNVVNATGGQGVTGHSRGARARPDGYTLTLMTAELNMLHWRGLTTVTPGSFAPLLLFNRDPAAVFVRRDAPWRSLADLERFVRSAPGSLRATGSAQGSIWHLAFAGWYGLLGEDPAGLRWLPSQGAASAMAELLAGSVDVVCCSLPEAAVQVSAGEVRCLGVMSRERVSPAFADVPTFAEQGYDWSIGGWRAVGVPRDTPPGIRGVLAAALGRVVGSPAFRGFMDRQGYDWRIEGEAEARATLAEMDRVLGELLREDAFSSIRRGRFGAMVFPAALAVALLGLLAALLATGGLRGEAGERPRTDGWVRLAEGISVVVLFIVLVRPLGFVVAAGGLLGLHLFRLGARPWAAAVLAAVVVPLVYAVFAVLLRVDLPRGPLGW